MPSGRPSRRHALQPGGGLIVDLDQDLLHMLEDMEQHWLQSMSAGPGVRELLEVFCPSSLAWRRTVVDHGLTILRQVQLALG